MNGLLVTMSNYLIGTVGSLPSQEINVDLNPIAEFAGNINYFVPLYLIAPILGVFFGFIGVAAAVMAIWGWIKRNF